MLQLTNGLDGSESIEQEFIFHVNLYGLVTINSAFYRY